MNIIKLVLISLFSINGLTLTNILVDRSDAKSRQAVFLRAQKRLKQGLRMEPIGAL